MACQPSDFMRCLLILSLLICQVPAYAAEEEVKIDCRFLCLENASPPPLICVSAGGAEVTCKVPNGAISKESVCYVVENAITFLTPTDRKTAAVAKIPANLKRAILIFVAGPKTPGALPWQVFVIEDSTKNMPDGGAFLVNFHNQDIRSIIGEAKIQLRPGMSTGVGLPPHRDEFNMATVAIQFQLGDKWRDASETMLRFLPGIRYLIFAYLDPESGRPKVRTVEDTKINVSVPTKP